jgi:hypothetical protein
MKSLDIPLPDEPYPPLLESLNKTPNMVSLINDVYICMLYYGVIWKKNEILQYRYEVGGSRDIFLGFYGNIVDIYY